jgi:hypothetical protein
LSHPVAAAQVNVDDLAELLWGLPSGRHGRALACVVYEHVDLPELGHRGLDDRFGVLWPRDIGGDGDRAAAALHDDLARLLEAVGAPRGEYEVCAGFRKCACERDAEAG